MCTIQRRGCDLHKNWKHSRQCSLVIGTHCMYSQSVRALCSTFGSRVMAQDKWRGSPDSPSLGSLGFSESAYRVTCLLFEFTMKVRTYFVKWIVQSSPRSLAEPRIHSLFTQTRTTQSMRKIELCRSLLATVAAFQCLLTHFSGPD